MSRLRRWLPTAEQVRTNRWLRWLGPALHHPRLWHLSRRGIALGVALGVFFGLLFPIAQMPFSAAAAVALRANVPAAVASTLVTNPATFGPIYYAAWRVGEALIGSGSKTPSPPPPAGQEPLPPPAEQLPDESWVAATLRRIAAVGKPLLLGLALFAVGLGALSYFLVSWIWAMRVRSRRRHRLLKRGAGGPAAGKGAG